MQAPPTLVVNSKDTGKELIIEYEMYNGPLFRLEKLNDITVKFN